jgi:hypothetical protein
MGEPAVIGRVHDGALWLDLRTILPAQDEQAAEALINVLRPYTTRPEPH